VESCKLRYFNSFEFFDHTGMYDHIKRYPWVLPLFEYENTKELLQDLESKVIAPAEEKAKELTRR